MTETALPAHFATLCRLARDIAILESVQALLAWDQETYMPPGAAAARAEQKGFLAGLIHERRTSPQLDEALRACEADADLMADPDSPEAADVRELRRDVNLATRLPRALVEELARTGAQAQQVWKQAREQSDFALFRPWLERMIDLSRQKAACYGWADDGEPYDALLDEFEPGATCRQIAPLFARLGPRLTELIQAMSTRGRAPDDRPLHIHVDTSRQQRFVRIVLEAIGFDLTRGRIDTAVHPFCEGLAPGDTRLTTRYREHHFTDALYAALHEAGHGMYEQGLPKEQAFGRPIAQAVSLGIHESQSRMWENQIGRSREFWSWALPIARRELGSAIEPFDVDAIYHAVNIARPSFIRVEADEATYNLHIMLRFDIERALIAGTLAAGDVPAAWNEAFRSYLGLDVPDDRHGCLQDVHWSFGLIGYFPTYCLGNLYAAQLWAAMRAELPQVDQLIAQGQFGPIRQWLASKVHVHGRRYRASELCRRVTGQDLSIEPLLDHLRSRLGPIYDVRC